MVRKGLSLLIALMFILPARAQNPTAEPTDADDEFPQWSPDGAQILFQSTRSGNEDIYLMDADGAHVRRLTEAPTDAQNMYPVWSPDGTHIVFQQSSPDEIWSVAIMDADGSNVHTLAEGGSFGWSPDSQKI